MTPLPILFTLDLLTLMALVLGYASHLLADFMTKTGIRLCYPNDARFYLVNIYRTLTR